MEGATAAGARTGQGLEQELRLTEDSTRHWAVLHFNALIYCRDEDAAA